MTAQLSAAHTTIASLKRQIECLTTDKADSGNDLREERELHQHDLNLLRRQLEERTAQLLAQRELQHEYIAIIERLKTPVLEMASTLQTIQQRNIRLGMEIERISTQLQQRDQSIEYLEQVIAALKEGQAHASLAHHDVNMYDCVAVLVCWTNK